MKKTENDKKWEDILNEFRSSEVYKLSRGINLFAIFYQWLYTYYEAPTKLK
jgi:hypothetical protein